MSEKRYGEDEEDRYFESIRRNEHITALESERDGLMTKMIERNDQLIKANEEIDRLKAELEACIKERIYQAEQRDLWKSKAEKLEKVLRIISVGNMEATAEAMNYHQEIAKAVLEEFEKGK